MAKGVAVDFDANTSKAKGEFAKVWKEIQKSKEQAKAMGTEVSKMGKSIETSGNKISTSMSKSRSDLKTYLVGLGSVVGIMGVIRKAVALIGSEWQNVIEQQQKAAQAQITLATAHQDLIRNLAGRSEADIKKALDASKAISGETGVKEKYIVQGMASAVSASGGDIDASEAAVKQAALYLADKPAQIGAYAGSLLDLSKVTGSPDAAVNMGLLAQVGSMSRVVNPQQQAMNIPQAMIGQRAYGSTVQGAAALFSTMTTETGDITGAQSKTASISLTQQLREFLPELKTTTERIRALQASSELSAEFMSGASFEKSHAGAIEKLLTDAGSSVARAYEANLQAIPNARGLAGIAGETIANRAISPVEGTAGAARTFDQGMDDILTGNLTAGEAGAVRDRLKNTLLATGQGKLATQIDSLKWEVGTILGTGGSAQRASDILADRSGELRNQTEWTSAGFGTLGGAGAKRSKPASASDLRIATQLDQMVALLRELNGHTSDVAGNTKGPATAAINATGNQ